MLKCILEKKAGATRFGSGCFISPDAHIYTDHFEIGENSFIASGVILRGDFSMGANCSINPNTQIAGKVRIGNGVRIAGLVSIYGFNHGHSRADLPIYQQPHTSLGIVIGDDIWVGSHCVILDGVTIGPHSIIAAGAVVTKSFPPYSVIAGVPATAVRSRQP